MADNYKTNGNVLLIDPIDAVSDLPQELNGTPDYESMFIFVSLRARRRRRSVIKFEAGSTSLLESKIDDTNINMLGYDVESGEYTTKWTENEINEGTILEGFGITSVNIKTNSSYVPQVTIEFTDIRGLAFFNKGSKSPYQAIFDFPPPLFDLTVKGYYGKSLTYQLHLVKHSTQFQAETGNFVITAEFIARTFAPLTDVPFKYVDVLPLVEQETNASVDPKTQEALTSGDGTLDSQRQSPVSGLPPKNTHEFLLKLKNLYDGIVDIENGSVESEDLKKSNERIENLKNNISFMNNFKNNLTNSNLQDSSSVIISELESPNDDTPNFRILAGGVEGYNEVIQSQKTEGNSLNNVEATTENGNKNSNNGVNMRLYLAIQVGGEDFNRDEVIRILHTDYKARLFAETVFDVNEATDIKNIDSLKLWKRVGDGEEEVEFIALDVTEYYIKLNDAFEAAKGSSQNAKENLQSKISAAILNELGFKPTIYNVFKIICDDIDKFFNILRKVNVDAENHHKNFSTEIFGNNSIKESRVSAFPLYVSGNTGKCNVKRQVRQYPIELSNQVQNKGGEPFPEIRLVDNFINAFIRLQKELLASNSRSQEDADGNNKWIPITPFDSEIVNSSFGRRESPYKDIEFQYQNISDNRTKIINKIIERFYVLTQYTHGRSFFQGKNSLWKRWTTGEDFKNENIISILAAGEANNIAISLTNRNTINALKKLSENMRALTISGMIPTLKEAPAYSNVVTNTPAATSKYVTIGNLNDGEPVNEDDIPFINTNTIRLYKDRNLSNYSEDEKELYEGFQIYRGGAVLRSNNENSNDNPIDNYLNEYSDSTFVGFIDFLSRSGDKRPKEFTKENIIYSRDVDANDNFTTKYMNGYPDVNFDRDLLIVTTFPASLLIDALSDNIDIQIIGFELKNSFVDVMSDVLADNRTAVEILEMLSGGSVTSVTNIDEQFTAAKAFLLGSNFTKARSWYHRSADSGAQLNDGFLFPSVVEVPKFSVLYMGGIVRYIKDSNFKKEVDALLNIFVKPNTDEDGLKRGIELGHYDIVEFLQDVAFVEKLMKPNDQNKLLKIFNDFVNNEFIDFQFSYRSMLKNALLDDKVVEYLENKIGFKDSVKNWWSAMVSGADGADLTRLQNIFKGAVVRELTNGSRGNVTEKLFEKYIVVVPSEFTFFVPSFNDAGEPIYDSLETSQFKPLSTLLTNSENANEAQIFFRNFFTVLSNKLQIQDGTLKDIENQANDSIKDNDIKGSLYYSFKSISDKWIAGLGSDINKGFPLNTKKSPRLIDKFMFVDRGMNPIGDDCIIDTEPLLDLAQDYDVNVFTVFSTLLSHNGFEFFPLQNFMSFKNNEWIDSFKIIESVNQDADPAFVCMYIGGAASQLNNNSSEYEDDGITDLSEGDLQDFVGGCNDSNVQETQNNDQPYSEVRAFRVRFSEQNQSFFNNIQLDGREFTETNDSLAILSKIAGDESNTSPVAKGQNLYSVYENRAYSAKVRMLGNMMIQPTQYFQLENIPMYSGAYVILDVEHSFTPNHAITEFQGTKILKYPNPIVTDFGIQTGFQAGSTSAGLGEGQTIDSIKSSALYDEALMEGIIEAASNQPIAQALNDKNPFKKFSIGKLETLHPQVKADFYELLRVWEFHGYHVRVNSGFRSFTDQANVDSGGNPKSAPGRSFHQYGLGIDISLAKWNADGTPTRSLYTGFLNPYWEFKAGFEIDSNTMIIKQTYTSSNEGERTLYRWINGKVEGVENAIDMRPLYKGVLPVTKYKINGKPYYKSMVQIAEELGFRWGGRFNNYDPVHFEKTLGYGYSPREVSRFPIYDGTTKPIYGALGGIDNLKERFLDNDTIDGRLINLPSQTKQFKNISFIDSNKISGTDNRNVYGLKNGLVTIIGVAVFDGNKFIRIDFN